MSDSGLRTITSPERGPDVGSLGDFGLVGTSKQTHAGGNNAFPQAAYGG